MKSFFALLNYTKDVFVIKISLLALTLMASNAMACPDLTGTYVSPAKQRMVLDQTQCTDISVASKDINQKLALNNQYVVVQEDADMVASGRGVFNGDILVLEVQVKYKVLPPLPRMLIPVRAVNKYTQMMDGNLQEISTIYNDTNGVITSGKTLYKKQLN